ncbi:MAG: metallophosphoesterase [Calditrichaceae bacterium]|nr:metallophosphoesterase [Calditrichaceae bacterium]
MRSLIFFSIVLTIIIGLSVGARFLILYTNKKLWNWNIVDKFGRLLPFFIIFIIIMAIGGGLLGIRSIMFLSAMLMATMTIAALILILSLPFSILFMKIGEKLLDFKSSPKTKIDHASRRAFLKSATAAIPMITLGTAGSGFAKAFSDVKIPQISMEFPNLPEALNGFKILHLSDIHLGYYFTLYDLEKLLINTSEYPVDMVLVTGDVSDDLSQLPDALKLIGQIPTIYPKFVSLGNHEYYRGINDVKRIIDAGPVPLLCDNGVSLKIQNAELFIGGANDPMHMRADINEFMRDSLDKTMKDSPDKALKLLMSHRPRALDVAEQFDIDLILGGHTHGGQIGLNGKSVFEGVMSEQYLWGKYQKGKTKLYTSSGVGHWFPYRLGCPAEAPIITLVKG